MGAILSVLEKETGGTCYKSYKYCFDSVEIPTLTYEDSPTIPVKEYGETDTTLKTSKSLKEYAKEIQKNSKPLFRYFLDGSRRIYKVDDITLNKRIFPIIGGQIGVACCEREGPSDFRKVVLENDLVLALPTVADADGTNNELFFNSLTTKLNGLPKLHKYNLTFSKILRYSSQQLKGDQKYDKLGIAKIQDEMIECEKKLVAQLVAKNLLNQNNFLLKDGSLQYTPLKTGDYRELSKIKSNYRCVVGVSKSFNPELCKDQKGKSNAAQIAKLPLYHRTPAFLYETERVPGVTFSIWYLRIRDRKYTESPFAGIVKIEKVLVSDKEIEEGLESDEVDLISANIINERNPVCYGSDNRWFNHLYPIYLTEKFIKSQYISDLHFLNLF